MVKVTRSKSVTSNLVDRSTGNAVTSRITWVKGHLGQGQRSPWSRSKAITVKVNGHMGPGQQKGHENGRWAHINVKLLH